MLRLLFVIALATWSACNDRTRDPGPIQNPRGSERDAGIDGAFDEPVRALCVPGARRCIAENSPLFDRCTSDGTAFVRASCDDGDVCRERTCVPFSCVPGRALCVGPTTAATCDTTGRAVEDITECSGDDLCLGGACIDACEQAALERSYIGCDYLADDLPNIHHAMNTNPSAPFGIVVANTAALADSRVVVSRGNDESPAPLREPFELVPGPGYSAGRTTELSSLLLFPNGSTQIITDAEVNVPPGAAAVFLPQARLGRFRITSSRPVVAYQFSPYCCNFTATNDASLLLPTATWGTRYRVVGYPAWRLGADAQWTQPYIRVNALSDAVLEVESPIELKWVEAGVVDTSFEAEVLGGGTATFETVMVVDDPDDSPGADLSGAVVSSDQPIQVFTGHPCTFVPYDQWACDHLEEAVLPADTLGERYVLSPVRRRTEDFSLKNEDQVREATYWKLVADEDTTVSFAPSLDALETLPPSHPASRDCRSLVDGEELVLEAGQACEFGATKATAVRSSAPILVAGVISGHQSTGVSAYGRQAGDPSMFLLGPVEQFRNQYAFANPPTFKRTYVTVTAPPGSPVTIDDRSIPAEERLERGSVTLDGQRWEVFTLAIEPGVHEMESTAEFGIVVYAYDDYVSYAFTGGLDLRPKGSR